MATKTKTHRVTVQERLMEQINADCEAGKWFWVAGLAREAWAMFLPVMDQLHEVAQMAVQHYADEATTA